jgi:HK97 family phage major capsid protein
MPTIREILQRREAIRVEMRAIHDAGELNDEGRARFAVLTTEAEGLNAAEQRQATLDDMERRAAGAPPAAVPGGDVGLLDAIRAQMGATDHAAGRAREMSREAEIRSGRKAEGLFWNMEARVLTLGLPADGPGSNLVATQQRPDLFIDRLRNATRVRAMGATVLGGLVGNVVIPRRKASVTSGWVAENTAITASDPQFDSITLSPKHAGAITEYSRNMILQSSPDVESLTQADMVAVLAETLDAAAIAGTGTSNQPTGILNTTGIGSVAMGTNGGALTYDAVADLVGTIDDANADGTGMALLTNTKVRRAAAKLKDSTGVPLGLDTIFQGKPASFSNLVPSTLTKGSAAGTCSALIYGNWQDLLIGVWSEIDILVNPYESTAYAKGNVSIRAMMSIDLAVRHPESFAAIKDIVA